MVKRRHSSAYTQYLNSARWQQKSRWVRSLTRPFWLPATARGRCCLFPFLAAKQTHHLTYFFWGNWGWNTFGFEQPMWHLVPLSETAHDLVGSPFLWQQPIRFLVNTYLRLAFFILWTICKPWWSLPFWQILFLLWRNLLSEWVSLLIKFLDRELLDTFRVYF